MKVKASNIVYDITEEDIENNVDFVLEVGDLVDYKDKLDFIFISDDIVDVDCNEKYDIIFSDINDYTVYTYEIYKHNATSYSAKLVSMEPYDAFADYIMSTLPDSLEFEYEDEYFDNYDQEDMYSEICDAVSDKTGWLVDSLTISTYKD